MKKTLFFFAVLICCRLLSQEFWYSYSFQDKHVGYTKVVYQWQEQEKSYIKKQEKYRRLDGEEKEEISCVLSLDYSVLSGYISSQTEKGQEIFVITASDKILIQNKNRLISVPGEKIYLEISDFLKGIAARSKLEYGRIYKGLVLSGDRMGACDARARYLGKEVLWANLEKQECHTFDVTTSELKNFWAKAQMDANGNLIGYSLGSFQVLRVPKEYALEVRQNFPEIPAPFIFDIEQIDRMYIRHSDFPFPIPSGPNQRNKEGQTILRSPDEQETQAFSPQTKESIQPGIHLPSDSEFLLEYAKNIQGNSRENRDIAQKIALWVQENLEKKKTPQGNKLAFFLGFSRNLPAIAHVSLSRACKIPSRLVSGVMYTPGKWIYATWAEVFLGKWMPLYSGGIARGAYFIAIVENKAWGIEDKLVPFSFTLHKLVKKGETLLLDNASSYLSIQEDKVTDKLLGITFLRPADWVLLPKNTQSDMLLLRSIKGNGPAILIKVFELPRSLEEILDTLSKKMGTQENLELLWQQSRPFPKGKAIEVALKSQQQLVYRAFLGEQGKKGIAALLIVPAKELLLIEKGFQDCIFSLNFY
ncbi:MAG: transglutaminase family protein [Candidatus Brocadiae bacterium]|nr:transglutaminase family protein [Candidatus Brocadiia bacterium]